MNSINTFPSNRTGLINDPSVAYEYENGPIWVPLPIIPEAAHPPLINIQEPYDLGKTQTERDNIFLLNKNDTYLKMRPHDFRGNQTLRNALAGSNYKIPNLNNNLVTPFDYQFPPQTEYYTSITPVDRAYQISRLTNCMGPAPRIPGYRLCPYGSDAIACSTPRNSN